MVDLIDAVEADPYPAAPEPTPTTRRARINPREWKPREWKRHAPLTLVAFAVGFGFWLLRAELRAVPYPNDAGVHESFVRFAEQQIRSGRNPFDSWYPYLGLGTPQFLQYQALSHILTGLLSIVFGDSTFRWVNYLLMCTWPITIYVGARLLDLDPWEAGAAALFSPMLVNIVGYGYEWASFVWIGSGMWSMLWALWLLPITLGLAWRAVSRGERFALATFAVGLTCALHFVTGYLVLASIAVFVLVRPPDALKRIGRGALMGFGGLLMFAFVFVPTIGSLRFVTVDQLQVGTFWVDSYGASKVFTWLFHGQVFDSGRHPVISLAVALGVLVAFFRSFRHESARVPLGLMILSLMLWSGRRVVGPVIDRLPGGSQLLLHRYIIAVHFAGLLLAGIGAVWAFRRVYRLVRYLFRFRFRTTVAIVVACGLAFWAMYPVLTNRSHYADVDSQLLAGQIEIGPTSGKAVTTLINEAKQRGGGRIYAGVLNGAGATGKINQISLLLLPVQQDEDALGFTGRVWSLSADIETAFNPNDPAAYDLFNVKYVLIGNGSQPGVPATLISQLDGFTLWEVKTSGYLEVVDTTEPVAADNTNILKVFGPYLSTFQVSELRHPLVAFDGAATPAPSSSVTAPYTGPPGSVDSSSDSLGTGRFEGTVTATKPAWVMLKESYAPHWTATVDGLPVKTAMLAPSFVGVPVPAGTHHVVFQYRSQKGYPALFAFGVLTLLAFVFAPSLWRRYRKRRTDNREPDSTDPDADSSPDPGRPADAEPAGAV